MTTQDFDRELERAVFFLFGAMAPVRERHHKPVTLHSIRVAMSLYETGNIDLVIAAALHDVVEDAEVSLEQIKAEFGSEVARLVAANTWDRAITSKAERHLEMFRRCKAAGRDALLIKAADILANSGYYLQRRPPEHVDYLLEKMAHFIKLSRPELEDQPLWRALQRQHQALLRQWVKLRPGA